MHCFIMGGTGVDHEDGKGLNNQKFNLRTATVKQNNRHANLRADNISGHKGVHWNKHCKKWHAQICVSGRKIHLGLFNAPEDAARVYDVAALKYHGKFALTNAMLGLLPSLKG
jgi:hypothetical protein